MEELACAVFATRDEAERYVADYGSDKHVAEIRARIDDDVRTMKRSIIIHQLQRGLPMKDDDA